MNWLDVCGSPGSGKSTLCDHFWHPHAIPIEDRLPPAEWHDFLNEISRLFYLIRRHPAIGDAVSMVNRSVRKIATVARVPSPRLMVGPPVAEEYHDSIPYIQTALAQRGFGFGWRMVDLGVDINELRHYFRLMPVSIGVAVTRCPQEIVEARNHARKQIKATAHEDRAFMVKLMQPAVEIAKEVLHERGVPLLEVDTTQPVEAARAQLLAFASQAACGAAIADVDCQQSTMSAPPWWLKRKPQVSNEGWRPYRGLG